MPYEKISASSVPDGVHWDVPARHQGQIVEIAYGGIVGDQRTEYDEGDPYMRITDRGDPLPRTPTFYRFVGTQG